MDVSNIFYFFCLGGGEVGSPRRREGEGGDDFFIENPRGGGVPGLVGAGGARGREGVCGALGGGG